MTSNDNRQKTPSDKSDATLKRWALFAEIAGAVAVVLSVIYLALQVSDNNRLLRSQGHYNALELSQRPLELMVENEDLARIMVACELDPNALDRASWERCSKLAFDEPFRSYVDTEFAAGQAEP